MENKELQSPETQPQNTAEGAVSATENSRVENSITEPKAEEATKPKEPLKGEVTAEQVLAWKALHGDVFQFVVDGHVCYLKRPNRGQYAYAVQLQSNPVRSNEYILKNCWLGGAKEILEAQQNDSLFMNVQNKLGILMDTKAVEISKL